MSRNDIRFRRSRMTSRRIERHKDYDNLMRRYERGSLTRKIMKWVIAGVVLALFIWVYFLLT